MKRSEAHVCRERNEFEVLVASYPHVVFRCKKCFAPMRSIPVDDLDEHQIDLATEMLALYYRKRKEFGDTTDGRGQGE